MKTTKLIEKQAELIKRLSPYFNGWGKDREDVERLFSEIAALEKEPTAMEMIKEVFEPIQLTEEEAQKCYPDLCFCEDSAYIKGVCDKCGKYQD